MFESLYRQHTSYIISLSSFSLCLLSDYSMQIWKNGVVTFGVDSLQAKLSTPTRNFSAASATYLVAPLWFQNISSQLVNSDVSWEEQRKGEKKETDYVLQFASDAVADFSQQFYGITTEFTPTWAVIINWNVSLAPSPYEREYLCMDYFACNCEKWDPYYYDYGTGDGNSGSTPTPSSTPTPTSTPSSTPTPTSIPSSTPTPSSIPTPSYGSGSGSGCDPESCYGQRGWSTHDISYLELLCNPYDTHYYYYYYSTKLLVSSSSHPDSIYW